MLGRRNKMELIVRGISIESKGSIKYLRVIIVGRLNFKEHLKFICEKTSITQGALARMMLNIGDRNPFKRKIISRVVTFGNVICLPNMVGGTLHGHEKEITDLGVSSKLD